jgi:hypothetical protein
MNLGLDETCTGVDSDLLKTVQEEQQFVLNEADIVIVTHTMLRLLTWKLRHHDSMEQSGQKISKPCGEFAYLSVDEAHTLPKITRSGIEESIRFDVIHEVLDDAPMVIDKLLESLTELESYINEKLSAETGYHAVILVNNADEFWSSRFYDRIQSFFDQLVKVYDESDNQPLFQCRIESVLSSLSSICMFPTKSGTSSEMHREAADSDAYPILFRRGKIIGITLKAGRLGRNIASLWRRNADFSNKRLYKSVIMMSGTLLDAKPDKLDPYRYFRYEIGATRTSGDNREVIWYGGTIHASDVGCVTQIIYPERSVKLVPVLPETFEPNKDHTLFLAKMLAYIFDIFDDPPSNSNRILALFMSEQSLSDTFDVLSRMRPDIVKHCIVQRSGMRFVGKPLDQFRENPRAILFSMNWAGINPVDKDERSIVDHLVLTKAPFPPVDERRQRETHGNVAIKAMFTEAHWRFLQGLGRAMRDPTARFKLWIGDPRIPLPDELTPPYAKYIKETNRFIADMYEQFNITISNRLFGQIESRSGIFAKPVRFGYLEQQDDGLVLRYHDVILAPR